MVAKYLSTAYSSSPKGVYFLVNYQEQKCDEGKAKCIINNTFASGTENIKEVIFDTTQLNKKVKKLAYHICLSFKDKDISEEKHKNIASDYLEAMGYSNAPHIAYLNTDTTKNHIHIITSRVDYEGARVEDKKNFPKSFKACREIEKKYGIEKLEIGQKEDKNLNELNAEKYKYQKGIQLALKNRESEKFIKETLSVDQIDKIKGSDLTNYKLNRLLGDKSDIINKYLKQNDQIFIPIKDKLRDELLLIYQKSSSENEFYKQLKENNIYYTRILQTGGDYLKYGYKQEKIQELNNPTKLQSFYIRDNKLPESLRLESISSLGQPLEKIQSRAETEQKKYLRNIVIRVIKSSGSIKELEDKLKVHKVEMILAENKRGIYGVSFKSLNVENAKKIKGSDIDRSITWENIKHELKENLERKSITDEKIPEKDIQQQSGGFEPAVTSIFKDQGQRDEEDLKKKKKRKKGLGRN